MSLHLLENLNETKSEPSSIASHSTAMPPCRLVLFYEDQDSKNRAERLVANLKRLFTFEIQIEESWWKLSVLGHRLMRELAVADAINADLLLFSFGASNELSEDLIGFNQTWTSHRTKNDGLLAIQLENTTGDTTDALRKYFRELAKRTKLDYLATETEDDFLPDPRELVSLTQRVRPQFHPDVLLV